MLHWVSSVVGLYTTPDAYATESTPQPTTATSSRSPTPSSDRRRQSEGWILLHPNGELEVDDTGSLALSDNDQSHGDGDSVFGYDNGAEFGDARMHQHDENAGDGDVAIGENDVESFSTRSDDEEEEVEEGDGGIDDDSPNASAMDTSTTDHMMASADNLIIPMRESPLAFSVPHMPTASLLLSMSATTPAPFAVSKITNRFVEYPPPEFPPTLFSVVPEAADPPRRKAAGPTPYEIHVLVRKAIDRLSSPNTCVVKHPHPVLARLRNHEFMVRKMGRLDSRVGRGAVRSIGKRAGLGLGNKGSGPAIGRATV